MIKGDAIRSVHTLKSWHDGDNIAIEYTTENGEAKRARINVAEFGRLIRGHNWRLNTARGSGDGRRSHDYLFGPER